jgi:hypothetical protein
LLWARVRRLCEATESKLSSPSMGERKVKTGVSCIMRAVRKCKFGSGKLQEAMAVSKTEVYMIPKRPDTLLLG